MKKRYCLLALILSIFSVTTLFSAGTEDIQTVKVTNDRIKLFPVPSDNKNYIFLQSIGNETTIVIGDFSGVDKKIIMIVDRNNDNTIDSVVEYMPLKKEIKIKTDSQSRFFSKDIAKLKRDIIEGTVYQGNYTDEMKSLKILENIIKDPDTNNLTADVYGFRARLFETDERTRCSAVFFYGKNEKGYYLQFKTEYYRKDFNTEQVPVMRYSVFCKDTNDPVVKETVENLFKIKQPAENSAKIKK